MPKDGEPCDEQAHVMAGGDQNSVDGVARGASQMIALEEAVALGAADNRLNGVASTQFPPDRR